MTDKLTAQTPAEILKNAIEKAIADRSQEFARALEKACGKPTSAYEMQYEPPEPAPPITASQFKEGDQVRFIWTGRRTLHFTVAYVDSKFAYLRAMFDQTSEYRVSLRSSELRAFDQMGWTLMEGRFDQHVPTTKAIS